MKEGESYPEGWEHATVHLNPRTKEIHIDGTGARALRRYLADLEFTPDSAEPEREQTVWIPSVPLPFFGWRTDRCQCGARFRGRDRREQYEIHWRRVHEPEKQGPQAMMEVTRSEAQRIYGRVHASGEARDD